MDQGFAPTTGSTREIAADVARVRGTAREVSGVARPAAARPVTGNERAARTAGFVESLMGMAMNFQFLLIPSFLMRRVGLVQASAWLRAPSKAIAGGSLNSMNFTLSKRSLGNALEAPGEMLRVARDQFDIVGNKGAMADRLGAAAVATDRKMASLQARVFAPAGQKLSGSIDRALGGKKGGSVWKLFDGFAQRREVANLRKARHADLRTLIDKATTQHGGVFSRLSLGNLEGMSGAALESHLTDLERTARGLIKEAGNPKAAEAMEGIAYAAGRQGRAATAAIAHGSAIGGDLAMLSKNALKYAGRTPLLPAMMLVGAAATTAALYFRRKDAISLTEQAYDDFKADLGTDNHALLIEAKKQIAEEKNGRRFADGLNSAGQVISAATIDSMGAVGAIAVPMLMAPMFAGNKLVKESPLLNAHRNLALDERGEQKLELGDKKECMRQIVGAQVDAMMMKQNPAHKRGLGYYNHLTPLITEQLSKQEPHLSVREFMRTVGNAEKFTALTVEARKEWEAKQAQAKAHAPTAGHATAQGKVCNTPMPHDHNAAGDMVAHSDANPIHHDHHLASDAKPALKLAAASADRALEGRVLEQQRALGGNQ